MSSALAHASPPPRSLACTDTENGIVHLSHTIGCVANQYYSYKHDIDIRTYNFLT